RLKDDAIVTGVTHVARVRADIGHDHDHLRKAPGGGGWPADRRTPPREAGRGASTRSARAAWSGEDPRRWRAQRHERPWPGPPPGEARGAAPPRSERCRGRGCRG